MTEDTEGPHVRDGETSPGPFSSFLSISGGGPPDLHAIRRSASDPELQNAQTLAVRRSIEDFNALSPDPYASSVFGLSGSKEPHMISTQASTQPNKTGQSPPSSSPDIPEIVEDLVARNQSPANYSGSGLHSSNSDRSADSEDTRSETSSLLDSSTGGHSEDEARPTEKPSDTVDTHYSPGGTYTGGNTDGTSPDNGVNLSTCGIPNEKKKKKKKNSKLSTAFTSVIDLDDIPETVKTWCKQAHKRKATALFNYSKLQVSSLTRELTDQEVAQRLKSVRGLLGIQHGQKLPFPEVRTALLRHELDGLDPTQVTLLLDSLAIYPETGTIFDHQGYSQEEPLKSLKDQLDDFLARGLISELMGKDLPTGLRHTAEDSAWGDGSGLLLQGKDHQGRGIELDGIGWKRIGKGCIR
ncbi:hypothetical protein TREMEDRAFT_65726 [Tremella mesenterica DSM 1558]|uniref:uncharacterized protein n=1 Tax=Tremella mesenterica (strain ATCC 24925 / CBS 8224 / DSM 1558 / NBRC 9311 / NRRL Y-6157 / RJB 2259-6 / UBC 559-6) TaxID=578456 RepID=UPI00032CAB2D|nr:uncharacterized protein TREMEDRAFT_65726 [Tremella mesenterica DSM 1558]EIW66133.1 hypothetical protein TREMEDRAFT_65726 [Tremella mesenterica DSM 1558]